jgi:hypothetical protein
MRCKQKCSVIGAGHVAAAALVSGLPVVPRSHRESLFALLSSPDMDRPAICAARGVSAGSEIAKIAPLARSTAGLTSTPLSIPRSDR